VTWPEPSHPGVGHLSSCEWACICVRSARGQPDKLRTHNSMGKLQYRYLLQALSVPKCSLMSYTTISMTLLSTSRPTSHSAKWFHFTFSQMRTNSTKRLFTIPGQCGLEFRSSRIRHCLTGYSNIDLSFIMKGVEVRERSQTSRLLQP
jgi:hypothetical protein